MRGAGAGRPAYCENRLSAFIRYGTLYEYLYGPFARLNL